MKMKKFFNYLCLAAIAAMTLVSCSKNEIEENLPTSPVKKVSFSAKSADPDTKTIFGDKTSAGYPTVWTSNQKVSIALNFANAKQATVTPSADGKTATFTVTVNDDESGNYVFYALSPAVDAISWNASYQSVQVDFPANQAPTMGSVDEKAHIMAAKSATFTEFPSEESSVSLTFSHIAAYGKFMLKNFPETVTITGVDLTADENIVGRVYFYPETGEYADNSAAKTVSISASAISAESNASKVFWFGIKPVDLQGKNLKVTVHTDGGDYVKTITFPSGKGNFQAGKVAAFNIDFNGITPAADKIYTLVTSYDELTANSEVIIVANEADYALGTTDNGNNRAAAAITKGTNTVVNPGDAVQTFLLEAGTITNTVAFKGNNGGILVEDYYIGSANGGNYLKTSSTKGDNTSFGVILGSDGVAELSAKQYSSNILRFNNGAKLFACYASGQQDVAIYKLEGTGSGDPLVAEVKHTITYTQPLTGGSFVVTVDGDEIASGTKVLEGKVVTLTATAASGSAFSSWYVTGATVSGNTAVATFTVGTSDVEISATFVSGYTLSGTITGGSSGYDTESAITQGDISWKVMGNTTMSPWRIGGKNLNNVDRTIYSTTALEQDFNSIVISHGSISNTTVHSMTVVISKNADFSNPVYTANPTFVANGSVTVTKPSGQDWSNCYYKITYNVTTSGNNKYFQFKSAAFVL